MTDPKVTEITFIMTIDGQRQVLEFHRAHKIKDLLTADSETLGEFLRSIRDALKIKGR